MHFMIYYQKSSANACDIPNSLRVMHIKHFMAKSISGKFHIKYNMVTGRPVLLPRRQLRLLGRPVLFLCTSLKHKHMDEYLKIFFHVLVLFTPYSFPWPVHSFPFLSFLFHSCLLIYSFSRLFGKVFNSIFSRVAGPPPSPRGHHFTDFLPLLF